jgi:type I restriction enzyme M protein
MIENDLIEAIITLPRDMFYTTDISVTLWIINKTKNSQKIVRNDLNNETRSRKGEILFMDLRRWGSEFEKKFVELTKEDIQKVSAIYHNWKGKNWQETYKNIPEFCHSASFDEIVRKDFSLVPSNYISFIDKDTQIDFDSEMKFFQNKFREIIRDEKNSQNELIEAFKELGYDLDE